MSFLICQKSPLFERFSVDEQYWIRTETLPNQSWSALNVSATSTRVSKPDPGSYFVLGICTFIAVESIIFIGFLKSILSPQFLILYLIFTRRSHNFLYKCAFFRMNFIELLRAFLYFICTRSSSKEFLSLSVFLYLYLEWVGTVKKGELHKAQKGQTSNTPIFINLWFIYIIV